MLWPRGRMKTSTLSLYCWQRWQQQTTSSSSCCSSSSSCGSSGSCGSSSTLALWCLWLGAMNCTTMLQYKHQQTSLHCGLVHTDTNKHYKATIQTPADIPSRWTGTHRHKHRHKQTLQGYNTNTCRHPFTVDWYTQTQTNTTMLQYKHLQTSLGWMS